ncbi:MAG: hypothetical protein R3E96_01770 [Planctomycetota bacterium]
MVGRKIKKDPTGFLNEAEKNIKKSLPELQTQQSSIEKIDAELKGKRTANQKMVDKAEELSTAFKDAYKAAEANGSWPVEVEGASRSRTS